MLPTNKTTYTKGQISKHNKDGDLKIIYKEGTLVEFGKPQHLYLVSDREIKEGDWAIIKDSRINFKEAVHLVTKESFKYINKEDRKIEATTDPNLKELIAVEFGTDYVEYEKIPQIPESFIKVYVESQGSIKDCQIELKGYIPPDDSVLWDDEDYKPELVIKTRSDNTVIIHQSKTYSREDTEKFVRKALLDLYNKNLTLFPEQVDKWITENL